MTDSTPTCLTIRTRQCTAREGCQLRIASRARNENRGRCLAPVASTAPVDQSREIQGDRELLALTWVKTTSDAQNREIRSPQRLPAHLHHRKRPAVGRSKKICGGVISDLNYFVNYWNTRLCIIVALIALLFEGRSAFLLTTFW